MQRTVSNIRAAARNTGLFYLAGHRIPHALLRRVYLCSLSQFEFSPEFKIASLTGEGVNRYIVDRRSIFDGAQYENRADGDLPAVMERYYGRIFDLCRPLLEGCSMALGDPADFFHCLWRHPLLHGKLIQNRAPAAAPADHPAAVDQAHDAITILWADEVDAIRVYDHPPRIAQSMPEDARFSFRIADTMARWSSDLHISVPHRQYEGPGRETFLIPVLYGKENNIPVQCSNGCIFTRQSEQFALVV